MKQPHKKPAKSTKPAKPTKTAKQLREARRQRWDDIRRATICLLLLALMGGGFFFGYQYVYQGKKPFTPNDSTQTIEATAAKQRAQADAIFRAYLTKLAGASRLDITSDYALAGSPDTKMTGKQLYDTNRKAVMQALTMQCTAQLGNSEVSIDASTVDNNMMSYLRLDKVAGMYTAANGQQVDAAVRFAAAQGKWYSVANTDQSLQAQINADTFVLEYGIMAPHTNPQTVADVFIRNKVFDYDMNVDENNGAHVFHVTAHKAAYVTAVKQAAPGLIMSDKAVDTLFGGADVSESTSTLTIRNDGSLVAAESMPSDQCQDLIGAMFNGGQTTGASIITKTSTFKAPGSVRIETVTGARPITDLQQVITR